MSLELNIFINKIQRIPTPKIQEMFKQYRNEIDKLSFTNQSAILSFIEKRFSILEQISREEMMVQMLLFTDLSVRSRKEFNRNRELKENAEKELKTLDLMALIESLQYIESNKVKAVLQKYHNLLEPKIIETLIINLPEKQQIEYVEICRQELMNSEPNNFHNFMASIGKDAQRYILENFSEKFESYSEEDISNVSTCLYQENIPIYTEKYQSSLQNDSNLPRILMACNEENFEKTLLQFKDKLGEIDADELMQIICYKTSNSKQLYSFWINMPNRLKEVSTQYFKIFIRRLNNEDRLDSLYKFTDRYKEMNLNDIVELFENDSDEIKATVLTQYYETFSGEKSEVLNKFMSRAVRDKMIDLYSEKQLEDFSRKKEDGIDLESELQHLVVSLGENEKSKLFDYDYIRAILLSRQLLKDKTIDDKNASYLKLREKYMEYLFNKLERDNTFNGDISKSLFYRIVKGKIDFKAIDGDLKSVKGLIYLSRNPQITDIRKVEDILKDLTEKQVNSYNVKLYKKLCDRIKDKYKKSKPLDENIQKLAYKLFFFGGYDRALKILERKIDFTTLEYLFNDLKIKQIELNEVGIPKINEKLSNFLFGSNQNEQNANIYRLLNNEIPNSDKYISTICNDWDVIYKKLNGNVTLKRALDLLKSQNAMLKPNEYKLQEPLQEIGTGDPQIVQKAKQWYETMRERQFSAIPKVKGNYENYEYEVLDLDDPLALAVGYITRCCFLINGLSRQSLYHSISSKNGRTFVVRKDGELVAQSWMWRNGNVLCFDNVETRGNFDKDKLLETYLKASSELIGVSEQNEDNVECLKLITYGTSESHMTRPSKVLKMDKLPRVLEDVNYSDATEEQCILAEKDYDNLYYGEVSAKYKDPRLQIREYTNLSSLNDIQKDELEKQLNSIKYEKTGTTRESFVRDYRYIALNKDWYITINKKGEVEIQILDRDVRAKEECKEKAQSILQEIKTDKIVVPIDFDSVGGEDR